MVRKNPLIRPEQDGFEVSNLGLLLSYNGSLCGDAADDLITAAFRSLCDEMKRRHSGNIVIHHF